MYERLKLIEPPVHCKLCGAAMYERPEKDVHDKHYMFLSCGATYKNNIRTGHYRYIQRQRVNSVEVFLSDSQTISVRIDVWASNLVGYQIADRASTTIQTAKNKRHINEILSVNKIKIILNAAEIFG